MIRRRTIWTSTLILLSLTGLCAAGWFDWSARKIVVVKGTLSIKDDAERPFAEALANQTGAWLDELGLPHKQLEDGKVTPWTLRGARAVILPYNPAPTRLELKAFQAVVESGGILVVFYGMDPTLANLMHVKLGPYRRAEAGQPWRGFLFDTAAVPGLPERVYQTSDHLVPATPGSGAARVIARWTNARGQPTAEAAWIKSPAGFWMSHVLQPGNDEDKKQLLLALLATVMPDVWEKATSQLLSPARPFGDYASLKDACVALNFSFPHPDRNSSGPESYRKANATLADLTRRYAARRESTTTPAIRAIWVDDSTLAGPDSWPDLATSLCSNGINRIFLRIGNPLALRAPHDLLPPAAIAEQHDHPGLLHAWLTCLNLEGATSDQVARLHSEGRLQISDTGAILPWLCPSHPANRILLTEAATTLARSGVFGGIHLDYIRCRNSTTCYCDGCRRRFEQGLGRPLVNWPADARSGDFAIPYRRWRAGQISSCVEAARNAVKAVNPALQISAAVYGATPSCYSTVGQDWPAWLDRGLLDFACPMNYTSDLKTFESLLKVQSALPSANRIIPGLGVSSSLSRLTPDQAVAQTLLVRRTGFPGFAVFESTPGVDRNVLPCLKLIQ